MKTLGAYEKCRRYIECHSTHNDEFNRHLKIKGYFPTVTISRQTGAGATMVGENFTEIMNQHSAKCEWTYFDKNLIEKVLADYNLPEMFAGLRIEDKYSNVDTLIKDFFWFNESNWTLVQKTSKTILKLAEIGNVILVGRGANVITAKLKNVSHVRLVAPLEARIKHVQEYFDLSFKQADEYIKREEQARKNYLKSYFYKEIDNPVNYHLILNTHLLSYRESAKVIARAVIKKFPKIYPEVVH
jgi:cytidylate kinase